MVGVEFPLSNGARRSSLLANCAKKGQSASGGKDRSRGWMGGGVGCSHQ